MKLRLLSFGLVLAACQSTGDVSSGGDPFHPKQPPLPSHKDDMDADTSGGQPGTSGAAGATNMGSPGTGITPATGATDAPQNPSTWLLPSKGLWIWRFDYTGKTAGEVATIAKELGVTYVAIKSGQSESFWSTRYTAEAVAEFTSRGIHVLAWPYITPSNVSGSIDAAVTAANIPGTEGLILDVEVEWETSGSGPLAVQLCDGIRAGKPDVWLGYSSFGWVGLHGNFPYAEFDQRCGDGFFPQVYWSDRGIGYQAGFDQAQQQLAAAAFQAPIWIVQSNDDIHATTDGPSSADLNAFFDLAGPSSSLWVFPQSQFPDKVTQLYELKWGN